MPKKARASKRRKKKSVAAASPLATFLPSGGWRSWLLRATLSYLLFNLVLNLGLALTRPHDLRGIFELGALDSRSQAAWLLSRHTLFHTSWEDEQNIPALIEHYAQKHGLEPTLFRALVEQESRLRPHAVSGVGACGLSQLMPETARSLGVKDPFNPHENLNAGARYLASMRRQFRGDLSLALAAYNAGPGNVRRYGGVPPFRETQGYVRKILTRHRVLRGPRKHEEPTPSSSVQKKNTAAPSHPPRTSAETTAKTKPSSPETTAKTKPPSPETTAKTKPHSPETTAKTKPHSPETTANTQSSVAESGSKASAPPTPSPPSKSSSSPAQAP